MARDTLIVTGADDRYAPLMREMLLSVRAHSESAGVDIGVLDCGLSAENCDWCRSFGATVVQPGWDVTFGAGLDVAPSFRAMTARPHLRRYFPGYEIYIWLDADVWVQDWSAIALLSASCNLGDVALIPEVHRSYRNFRDGRDDFETANSQAYAEAFGKAAAAQLIRRPLNNAGVFAMTSTSAAWELWAGLLSDAAQRSANMIDQIALNVAIYEHGLREVRLPATCNWIAHLATPAWDEARQAFVEPDPPHQRIGILHLTLSTKWSASLDVPLAGTPRGGAMTQRSLRYRP